MERFRSNAFSTSSDFKKDKQKKFELGTLLVIASIHF